MVSAAILANLRPLMELRAGVRQSRALLKAIRRHPQIAPNRNLFSARMHAEQRAQLKLICNFVLDIKQDA